MLTNVEFCQVSFRLPVLTTATQILTKYPPLPPRVLTSMESHGEFGYQMSWNTRNFGLIWVQNIVLVAYLTQLVFFKWHRIYYFLRVAEQTKTKVWISDAP